jgi:hypothetical protein
MGKRIYATLPLTALPMAARPSSKVEIDFAWIPMKFMEPVLDFPKLRIEKDASLSESTRYLQYP